MFRIRWILVFSTLFIIGSPSADAQTGSRLPRRRREEDKREKKKGEVKLDKARQYLLEGDFEKAYHYLGGASSRNAEILYLTGIAQLKLGYYSEARATLNDALSGNSAVSLKPDIMLGIADSYFMEEKYSKADILYKELLKDFPKGPAVPTVLSRLVASSRKMGQWSEAEKYFLRLQEEYPLSFEANSSELFSPEATPYFTVQVGSFADRANAERLCENLTEKGFSVYLEEAERKGDTFYRVRVGRLSSLSEAHKLRDRLKQIGLPTKIFP